MIQTRLVDLETEQDITEPGVPGELRFQGAATFGGYWENPEVTANAFDERGWYRTGDLFEIAGEGPVPRFYRFVGRCKDIIVRGGVNISPAEIDDLLAGHPELREAAVVGIPTSGWASGCASPPCRSRARARQLGDVAGWLKDQGLRCSSCPRRW